MLVAAGLGSACAEANSPDAGEVEVTINGLQPGFTSGGSARITGEGIDPIDIDLLGVSHASRHVKKGTYHVVYSPPGGYALAPGQESEFDVTVEAGQKTTIDIDVVVSPTPTGILFRSDWSTATGTADSAIRDTGKSLPWNLTGGQGLEVVASTGLGFPTTNVLKVNALGATAGFALLRRTGLPIPASGQSRWYRWYFQYTGPDGQIDQGSHPVQDGNAASDTNWMFNIYHDGSAANTWSFAWWPGNGIQPAAENRRFKLMANLNKGVTYRIECQIHRISATQYNLHGRVYSAAGALLYDDDDFRSLDGQGQTTLANTPALNFNNVNNMDGLNAGNNGGPGNSSDYPHLYGYQGAFAVSDSNWIGPYAGGI